MKVSKLTQLKNYFLYGGKNEDLKGSNNFVNQQILGRPSSMSARAVLTVDNYLHYGVVAIPLKIACTLRREEKVTEANLVQI